MLIDASVIAQQVAAWRERAPTLRRLGAEGQAATFEEAARELESALRRAADEQLKLTQAADESGYSADHLGREVKAGRIPNAGRAYAPKIRRGDLPLKPGHLRTIAGERTVPSTRQQIARAAITPFLGDTDA